MKQFKKWVLLLPGILACLGAQAQICLKDSFNYAVDITEVLPGSATQGPTTVWTTTGFDGEGVIYFNWQADGDAAGGTFWGNRQRIDSPSGGGAAVLNADSLDNQITFPPYTVYLTSPEVAVPPTGPARPVYLSFYQYYRNFNSRATVEICLFGNCDGFSANWIEIYDNDHVGQGTETPNGEKVVVNLTPYLYDNDGGWFSPFRIRFRFQGENYFWIVDDVSICEENPFEPTIPPSRGDFLSDHERPYAVDDPAIGGAYVPDQLVVEFKPGVPDTAKAALRLASGVDSVVTCACNPQLELWVFRKNPDNSTDTLSISGDTTTYLFEKKKPLTTNSNLQGDGDGVSYNYYALGDRTATPFAPPPAPYPVDLPFMPANVTAGSPDDVKIVILDSGVDLNNPDITSRLARNNGNGCYPNDSIGHNFVSGGNHVGDDHRHGTQIVSLILAQLPGLSCPYKILPVKTHDHAGIGTLFGNTCGLYYALQEEAKVVGISWGWLGEPSNIMKRAIDLLDTLNQAIVVVAAGNDPVDLNVNKVYPGAFDSRNIIVVGSVHKVNNVYEYSDFSNYSNTYVDIGGPGEDISIPGFPYLYSGTSFAAPPITAAAAYIHCLGEDSVQAIIDQILSCASQVSALTPYIADGRVLNFDFPCIIPPVPTGQLVYAIIRDRQLIAFDSKIPAIIRQSWMITGIDESYSLEGMDFRPATGQLYVLGYRPSTGEARLFTIDTNTGIATPVATAPALLKPMMSRIGMDFNPVEDYIRLSSSDNANYRLNPVTGALIAADPDLAYASGDNHFARNPAIGASAYTNSFYGTASTSLYHYDDSLNILVTQTPESSGSLQTAGSSGIALNLIDPSADIDVYFDFFNGANLAYMAANTGSQSGDDFFALDLTSGQATLIGKIGIGLPVKDIAVVLPEAEEACDVKEIGCMKYEILSIRTDPQYYKTYRMRVTNQCAEPLVYTAFRLPSGVVSTNPPHNSIYTSPSGHTYEVRNPSYSPFYSVRYKAQGSGIANGQSDVFEFTLPPYSNPFYFYVQSQLASQVNYGAHLNIFGCTVTPTAVDRPDPEERSGSLSRGTLYPNPTTGELFVGLMDDLSGTVRVRVLNTRGQTIYLLDDRPDGSIVAIKLPETLPDGLYYLEILSENGDKHVERFVLQR